MARGLAWVGANGKDSGKVLIRHEGGREEYIETAFYAVSSIQPPLHELPQRAAGGPLPLEDF